jgi:hypothetical protein
VPEEAPRETALDWTSAAVDERRLTVSVVGEPPAGWTGRLGHVIERLHRTGHGWGKVKVTKKAVTVDDVSPGTEADLHHFLESAVLQVNADLAADDDDAPDEERSEEDQRMTDAFRSLSAPGAETDE